MILWIQGDSQKLKLTCLPSLNLMAQEWEIQLHQKQGFSLKRLMLSLT